ncbi:DUF4956 domain-containing protein [Tepidimicrobium xylanilyticum]|uniref:DUF4956 domain-containing protein n=1 Tax=Tepidimicrobium xylanilyticum TaxID=1123352 RepID=A0A1H2WRE7_9FIRM|nr:DUF4956 domain-containing protein [Tepidimicrobium xylanilyticum]GMG97947.1 DUF4956 domain-containing protein [Tepidimicrobium xylanilyticum]SDW83233.1 protein of unknown function [Tepidimicrobium xylanilyticum]
MKELLYNLLHGSSTIVTPMDALQNMVIALILGVVVCITYRITYSGVAYSSKFNTALMMLSLITTMVMNILGTSLALSLGMVGALSIVRFRTAIKDPRDTTYIFWAISIGMGAGSSNYYIVIIGTLFIAATSIAFSFSFKKDNKYLVIVRGTNECIEAVRAALFSIYRPCKLRAETVTDDYTEIVYQIKLNNKDQLIDYENIKNIEGVSFVNMVARDGETLG